jgi:hypothetical protein
MNANHCQIVEQSLTGERAVDEQTFASLAILNERLEHLKNLDGIFGHVMFSPDVKKLSRRRGTVAVS